ncbi:MAG TPA: S28 family serine protease [Kofleriaceae bacterium]|jgi:hypothetical protein
MKRAVVVLAGLGLFVGCGDNTPGGQGDDGADAGPDNRSFEEKLSALPGVTVADQGPSGDFEYYVLQFAEPVDHDDPASATFPMEVSLIHRDETKPLVVFTTGYSDYWHDSPWELTYYMGGDQISIEHRFFGTSKPASIDWTKLTIQQMAADQHDIVTKLKTIYTAPMIATGPSKGGMTPVFYRRFYPDDVAGTVPYVAPISFGDPDTRYAAWFDTVGPSATCRQRIKDLAIEMLHNRRAAIVTRAMAQSGHSYTRIAIGPAVESSIISFEWSFWQYVPSSRCNNLPDPATATDDQLFTLLDSVSPVTDNDDEQVAFFEAYYYQSDYQLGYPSDGTSSYLAPYLMYTDADYAGITSATPTYDGGAAMNDVADWLKTSGSKFAFIYGSNDPWTAGKFDLGGATDATLSIASNNNHNSEIHDLEDADHDKVLDQLQAWSGVPLDDFRSRERPHVVAYPKMPRIPSAFMRAGHLAR